MGPDVVDAVRLRGVTKRFGEVTAVAGVDLRIATGKRVALLGLNGAGKTTTISMILGLARATSGTVQVLGQSPRKAIRGGLVGAMLQSSRLPPRATVSEVVELATRLYPNAEPGPQLLEQAGLTGLHRRRVERLSGGEMQRVKFAIAAAGSPRLLMLDEPTTAMDVPSRHAFWQQMRDYAGSGRTIIYCTHLMEEATDADEVVVMRAGHVVAHTTPERMRTAAGLTRVSIQGTVPQGRLRLPADSSVSNEAGRTVITADDSDTVVYELARHRLIRDLRVEQQDLDTAFLALAGDPAMHTAEQEVS